MWHNLWGYSLDCLRLLKPGSDNEKEPQSEINNDNKQCLWTRGWKNLRILVSKRGCRILTLNAASSLCRSIYFLVLFFVVCCSVVVEALTRLLKVAVAFLCHREPRLCQILSVEGIATQLLPFSLGPGSLDGQQVDIARQGNSPSSEAPGQAEFDFYRPGQVQSEAWATGWVGS